MNVLARPMVLLLTLMIGFSGSPRATANTALTADAFVARYARVLDEDQVFYRWQSTASGENLARAGVMTPALDRHFMAMTENVLAGPGLYVAGSPLSSAEYLPQSGGNLLEVRIKKGTRVLDLTDPTEIDAMLRSQLNSRDLKHWRGDDQPLMIRYTKDWFVARNITDHAAFEMYPGPSQSAAAINETLGRADARVGQQIGAQVRAHRPAVIKEIAREHGLEPGLTRVLPDAELHALLEHTLAETIPGGRAGRVLTTIASQPRLRGLIEGDPRLAERATAALAEVDLKRLSKEDFGALTLIHAGAGEAGVARMHETLRALLSDPWYDRQWDSFAVRLLPILEHVHLSEDERGLITTRLNRLTKIQVLGAPVERLHQIARAAHIDDPDLGQNLRALKTRAQNFERARQTGSPAAVQTALVDQSHIGEFVDAYEHILAFNPNGRVNHAVEGLLKDTPDLMARLVRAPADFAVAASFSARVPAAFPTLYAAALGADPDARLRFVTACLNEAVCAHNLSEAITRDRGAILNGLNDHALVERLRQSTRDPGRIAVDCVSSVIGTTR